MPNGINKQHLTAPKSHLSIRLRLLKKRSLPRKAIIFALQMSIKYLALLLAFRQKTVSNPSLVKAAKRYQQVEENNNIKSVI